MAQTLTYGVIVPNADGKEQISKTGVEETRTLGASADAQIGNRATYADLSDTEGRLQGGIGAANDRITAANDWIAKLRLYIQENGAIRGAGIVDLRQDSPGQMTIVWMDPDTADTTEEVIDLPAGFGNFVEVSPGVWELHTEESTIATGQVVGLDAALDAASKSAAWATVADKPAAFPPETHTHSQEDVTGLVEALAALEYDSGWRDVTGLLGEQYISGELWIRRVGNEVWLHFYQLVLVIESGTSVRPVWNLPLGYRPDVRYVHAAFAPRNPDKPWTTPPTVGPDAGGPIRISRYGVQDIYNYSEGKTISADVSFMTADAILDPPPGVAVTIF